MKHRDHTLALAFLLATSACGAGCYHWVDLAPDEVERVAPALTSEQVRLTREVSPLAEEDALGEETEQVEQLIVHRVGYPFIQGWSEQRRRELRLDASTYDSFEVRRFDGGATAGVILGLVIGIPLVALAAFAVAFNAGRKVE